MDAVILYVDGNDLKWREQYFLSTGLPFQPNRYRDWGTLPFLLRGIDKCLPFVEKVHLVVSSESQVPKWIDRSQVHIVYHKDIIPEKYLPTFNSCVIELCIPFIEGLAEEFLYFNDDFFILNPCEKELFFKNGRPQMQFKEQSVRNENNLYRMQCLNSTNIARAALGIPEDPEKFLRLPHWPAPMRKSLCLEVWEREKERIFATFSLTRTAENANQYLFSDYAFLKGAGDHTVLPYLYYETDQMEEILKAIRQTPLKEICINDNIYTEMANQELIKAFKEKFPSLSRFESKDEDIIVSMTTYPARFFQAMQVWQSVLTQKTDIPFRCVMVLSEAEFPGKVLPCQPPQGVEILWHTRNIRSHMKLMPVLKKWPEATVITIDDDMGKPQGWLQNMIDDHRKWPEDIISCSFTYYLDSNMEWQRMLDLHQMYARGKNDTPSLVFQFARICSGHGTVFPAHSFTDERFFDENQMMTLAPTCDETWMWMFAMIEGKNFRQSSWVFDESAYNLPGTQQMETCLWRANRDIYYQMYGELFRAFPEFYQELRRRQRICVVAKEEDREKYPYQAVVTTSDERKKKVLMKMYQDRPNRVAEYEGAKLFPPGM